MTVRFHFVVDDNTRVLELLRGKIDGSLDALGLSKERWLEKNYSDRFTLIQRETTRVSYLAMNLRNPILAHAEVRRAIAMSIDRESIVRNKMFGLARLAGSLLAPQIRESLDSPLSYDPVGAEKLLDQAGFPRRADGTRFTIRYKTTPVREGFETALIFRQMLASVGIHIELEVVEPAVFLLSVRKGNFEMYSSRWLGVADGSLLYRTLDSKSQDNRVAYKNAHMDELLEKAEGELDPAKRTVLLHEVQQIMAADLPYFPLWFWNGGLMIKKDHPVLSKIRAEDLSSRGDLEPVLLLR
jgi:peptide/nickel transport system substrate-binding protein